MNVWFAPLRAGVAGRRPRTSRSAATPEEARRGRLIGCRSAGRIWTAASSVEAAARARNVARRCRAACGHRPGTSSRAQRDPGADATGRRDRVANGRSTDWTLTWNSAAGGAVRRRASRHWSVVLVRTCAVDARARNERDRRCRAAHRRRAGRRYTLPITRLLRRRLRVDGEVAHDVGALAAVVEERAHGVAEIVAELRRRTVHDRERLAEAVVRTR